MKYDPEERPTFAQIADKMEYLRIRAPAPPLSALAPTPPPSPPISKTSGHRNVNDQPSAWKLFKRRIQSTKKSAFLVKLRIVIIIVILQS